MFYEKSFKHASFVILSSAAGKTASAIQSKNPLSNVLLSLGDPSIPLRFTQNDKRLSSVLLRLQALSDRFLLFLRLLGLNGLALEFKSRLSSFK